MGQSRIVVALAGVLAVAGALTSVVLAAGSGPPVNELAILLVVTAYAVVAVLIGVARPGHPVGRLMLLGTCAWGLGEALLALAVRAVARDQVGIAGWLASLGSVRGLGWLVLVLGVPLVFPDGRTPWGGRRPVMLVVAAMGLLVSGSLLAPQPLDYRLPGLDSPTGLPERLAGVAGLLAISALVATGVALVVAVAGLIHRWRSGNELLRQQLVVYLAAFAAPLVLLPLIPTAVIEPWMFSLVTAPVPIAVAVALFQRRLYDLPLVVNRTVTFAALSAAVAGLYAVTVGGVGALLRDRGAPWLPWVAAGVVAVAFAPLRNALQRGVNRLTYGQWSQPADVLAATGRRLVDATDVPGLLQTLAHEIRTGLKLSLVEIVGAHGQRLAVSGEAVEAGDQVPLTAYGRPVGALRWSPSRLRPSDRQLLDDLAAQLGGVVHSAGLVEDLTEARERLILAREDERRRLRRDLHDGLGPTLAALTLQVDTVRNVLAGGDDADAELLRLRSGVAETVVDVRRLVEGLRPPALDEFGLDGALTQLAERISAGSDLTVEVGLPPSLPNLPAAAEVATYRIAQEALTNAVRHSGATRSRVSLCVNGGGIRLEVTDNGAGVVRARPGGLGLATMHERATELGGQLTILPAPVRGTTVTLWLPPPVVAS